MSARARRGRRNGQWALAEVSPHPGCKAYNEDVSSWILTLGLDSMRNDEGEDGRHLVHWQWRALPASPPQHWGEEAHD